MKETFVVELRNHFDMLSEPSDDIQTIYNKLKHSTEEVALTTLPKKEKVKKQPHNAHALVKNACKDVLTDETQYKDKPTRENQKNKQSKKTTR